MYSHKSGAQKRKEKQAREEAVSKCARTLFEVGVKEIDTNVDEQNILPSSSESDPSTSQSLVQDAQQEAETDVISAVINTQPKDTEQQRDIGLIPDRPSRVQIEDFVRQGPQPIPSQIASDDKGNSFPYTVLKVQRPNGEIGKRDWLVYSQSKTVKEPFFVFLVDCLLQDVHISQKHLQIWLHVALENNRHGKNFITAFQNMSILTTTNSVI